MAQRVDYAVFPGVREDVFIATLNKVLGHVRRSTLTARDFRDWLKEEGLWVKEEAPALLGFCDIHTDGTARLGPFAERMFDAKDDETAKEMLFKRLVEENTLLCKYVLEALDIEGGGRLHSTHELHRMLTSYVYPGKHIGLVPFQNWIKWIVASGRVKLIGIRWGLTDLGKQAVPRLRAVDPDEFLEDEAADGASPAAAATAGPAPSLPARERGARDGDRAAAPAAALAATAAAHPKAAPAAPVEADSEETLDLPPEPDPIDDAEFEKYEAQFSPQGPPESAPTAAPSAAPRVRDRAEAAAAIAPATTRTEARPKPLPRQTTAPDLALRQLATECACTSAPMELGELIATLRTYGRERGLGGGSRLLAHGLDPRLATTETARHLFLAGLLARLYALRADGSLADLLIERVGGLLPVAVLLERPESLAEVLIRWGLAQGDAASSALRAALLDAVLGGRALKAQADLPTALAQAPSSEVLIGLLGQGLMRAAPVTAQLWLVREMVRAGLWTRPSATEIAFVPTRPTRLMAYRLRLIDSHFAQGTATLLQIAKRLAAVLPPVSVEAAAFEELALSDHLRFDCTCVPICQTPCAWAPQSGETV